MSRTDLAQLAGDIASQAERLRTEIAVERVSVPPFRDIQELQRSLRTLEQELREPDDPVISDAC